MLFHNVIKIKMLLLLLIIALLVPSSVVYANEYVNEITKLLVASKDVDVLVQPLEQSEIIVSYETGDTVMVTGETTDGWYRVSYQDKVGYVKKTDLQEMDINMAALDEEFAANELDGKVFVEEVERVRTQITRSRIWGTLTVLLIIAILGVGMYSTMKEEHVKTQESQDDNNKETDLCKNKEINMKKMNSDKNEDNLNDLFDPIVFKIHNNEPLEIIDLDKQEL